ncbi:MAG: heme o synthase [Candidatus Limnocylindria bacterium]
MSRFSKLAVATAAATFVLIAVGGLVRATDSGLGCPDWPGCSTTGDVHAVVEYSHRVVAATVVVLILTLAAAAIARRRDRVTITLTVASAVLVLAQAGLGAAVVLFELRADLVTVHLALALTLLALTLAVADRALRGPAPRPRAGGARSLGVATAVTVALVGCQMLLGSLVTGHGAGLAFSDVPLMDGSLVPAFTNDVERLQFLHRALAVVVAAAVAVTAWTAFRLTPEVSVRRLAAGASILVTAQVVIGAANVLTRLAPAAVVLHLGVGALLWATMVALLLSVRRAGAAVRADASATPSSGEEPGGRRQRLTDTTRAYIALTKPRIIELLLVTTVPTMVLAQRGLPPPWLVLTTLVGGTLAAGSANAINCFIDRDIDRAMRRTRGRPLPRGLVSTRGALRFGIALGVVSFAWLWLTVNVLAALLAGSAILFYVFVYTLWMKRSTPQNIVIGGAAGCVPVLVGWAAVTGSVGLPALVLFAIVFYWTPPHFWALALRYRGDYAAAGVPMLPVVRGEAETSRQIVLYSLLLVCASLLLLPAAGMGAIYLGAATILGTVFVVHALRVWRALGTGRAPTQLFRYSISYLALLFAAIGLDSLVRLRIG